MLRESVSHALSQANFEVVAEDGDVPEFLNHLEDRFPSIGLVDVSDVPGGVKILQLARQRSPSTRLVALVLDLEPGIVQSAIDAGVAGVFSVASGHLGTLIEALHGVASGERLFPASAFDETTPPRPASPMRPHVSSRERQVLSCISAGYDNLKIAAHLGICERTVKAHVSALYRKLGAENRTQLALAGLSQGLVPPSA